MRFDGKYYYIHKWRWYDWVLESLVYIAMAFSFFPLMVLPKVTGAMLLVYLGLIIVVAGLRVLEHFPLVFVPKAKKLEDAQKDAKARPIVRVLKCVRITFAVVVYLVYFGPKLTAVYPNMF